MTLINQGSSNLRLTSLRSAAGKTAAAKGDTTEHGQFKIEQIDHGHVEVGDGEVAASWCEKLPGLFRHVEGEHWAAHRAGSLVLAADDGHPALSLFSRDYKEVARDTTIAFRDSGEHFVALRQRIGQLMLRNTSGRALDVSDIVDHEGSWSIYFVHADPSRFEVTTYDDDLVRLAR